MPAILELPLDDDLVVYRDGADHIACFNPTGAMVWRAHDRGADPATTAAQIAKAFDTPLESVAADVATLWRQIERLRDAEPTARRGPFSPVPRPGRPFPERPRRYHRCVEYGLLGSVVAVRYPDPETWETTHPLLAHLACADARSTDAVVDLTWHDGRYFFWCNGAPRYRALRLDQVGPIVNDLIVEYAYRRLPLLIATHAAVVRNDHHCVLLPGQSGRGKSTLTSALVVDGYRYLTDETAVLTAPDGRVYPVPTAISLKQGSWEALTEEIPELAQAPVYSRPDGRRLRYWVPPVGRRVPSVATDVGIDVIVFPEYRAGSTTCLEPVSRSAALAFLTDVGSYIPGRLDSDKVRRLVDWIRNIPCYRLRHGNSREAIAAIRSLA